MRKLTNTMLRAVAVIAVAGLAFTPTIASADVFTVDEGNVTGANDVDIVVDGLTGKYQESLTQDAGASGNFSATLIVQFTSYTLGGAPVVDQIGAIVPANSGDDLSNLYGLYALVTVSGTFDSFLSGGGSILNFEYTPTSASATIYTDPYRDTNLDYTIPGATADSSDDQEIAFATGLVPFPTSIGTVQVSTADPTQVLSGSYALNFTNVTLINPDGPLYWPSLVGFTITAVASGDVDPSTECTTAQTPCSFPDNVRGDTSISFQTTPIVPEPATLSLLGIGLLGIGAVARRRKA